MSKCFNCEKDGFLLLRPTYIEYLDQECCFEWCKWMDYICEDCNKNFSSKPKWFEKVYRAYHQKNFHTSIDLV